MRRKKEKVMEVGIDGIVGVEGRRKTRISSKMHVNHKNNLHNKLWNNESYSQLYIYIFIA